MTTARTILALTLALPLLGCAEDLTALEGVYTIESWTENETGCDAPGPSILETKAEKAIYLKAVNFLGAEFINVVKCPDLETCRNEAADDVIDLGGITFEKGSDSAGWSGLSDTLDGSCTGDVFENLLLSADDGTLRVEQRGTAVENAPRDSDDFCDRDAAAELAAPLPCGRLEIFTAVQVEDL